MAGFLASSVRVPGPGAAPPGSRSRLPPQRPAPHRRSAAPAWLAALGARPGAGRHRLTLSRTPARPALPPPRPRAAPPAMSRGSRLALAVSALLSAAIVAAVHIQQRRELERLRSGVVRDLERQNQKKENVRLLEEQIALTKQLIEERDKALMEKRSQQP
ncbi:protein PET117 homolog, mitochondrial [Serinus canaria]|uniref:protein PET117 homolog, mitochondrial n=1 Tax=Serinus canaria TaxID=9135 RepID=UPI0021CC8E62|nr:protein PET117 homolog, mitochondrial [Serinus canaria]